MHQLAPRVLAALAIAFSARVARADQCAVLTREQATAAAKLVSASPGRIVAAFCAPCGETAAARKAKGDISTRKTDLGFALFLGSEDVDIAYIYYAVGDDRYRNLAMAASCPVQSVPEYVTIPARSPETEVNQLIDAQVKDPFADATEAVYTADAVVFNNQTKPGPITHDRLVALVGGAAVAAASHDLTDRVVAFSRDRASAWIDLTLRLSNHGAARGVRDDAWRVTELAVDGDAGWRIAAVAWTKPTADAVVDQAAVDHRLPDPDTLDNQADAGLRGAFAGLVDRGFANPGSTRSDLVAIGTAPGERTTSGPQFARAWNAAWAKHTDISTMTTGVSTSGTTGWMIANAALHKQIGKVSVVEPVRLFFVFDKDATGSWQLAHAHFAVPPPN